LADSRSHLPPADDAFVSRALCYLDDLLDDEHVRRLNDDLAASAACREAFVELCELRGHLFEHGVAPPAEEEGEGRAIVPPPWFERQVEPEHPRRTWPYLAVAAAVLLPLLITLSVYFAVRPHDAAHRSVAGGPGITATQPDGVAAASQPVNVTPVDPTPAATVVATAQARWSVGDYRPGQTLPAGPLELTAGFAELRLKNGVSMIVQAPIRLDIARDAMSTQLTLGKLTATVPSAARGFAVRTASATVIDYGTEFGVEVAADRATRVEVFRGEVEAAAARSTGNAVESRQRLTQDQAVHVAPDATAVRRVAPTPAADRDRAFVRDLAAARMPIPLADTGAGVSAEGDADPRWEVVTDPQAAPSEYRPAFVHPAVPGRYPAITGHARWISPAKAPSLFVAGDYAFRTTVDLSGFDPATAAVAARVSLGDSVRDVRVNGRSVGLNGAATDRASGERTLEIPASAFTQGVNQVEFVVHNDVPANRQRSPFAFRVRWRATAAPIVTR
jgi:hypothetical protein